MPRRLGIADHKLSSMSLTCLHLFRATISLVGIIACSERTVSKSPDSVQTLRGTVTLAGSSEKTGWDTTAGPVMILTGSRAATDAAVVLPGLTDSSLASISHFDLGRLSNLPVDLFGAQGFLGSSTLQIISQSSDSAGCVSWPMGRLGGSPSSSWRIGFEKDRASGIPLDSMESMTRADSTRITSVVLGIVKSLRTSSDSVFSGIPYSIRKGYRILLPTGTVLVAEVVRKINEEANPREEHELVLAEDVGGGRYKSGFYVRSAGSEETLETVQLLAVVRLRASDQPVIILTFDYEDGGKIGLLERLSSINWQVTWKSAYSGC
jgi:hypothetical protein